jgi:DNA polymerase-1
LVWAIEKTEKLGAPLEDTMMNEALIDDRTVGYGLEECAKRHGVTAKATDKIYAHLASTFGGLPDRKQMQHFWKLPGDDPIVVDYATGDGISTLELWASQQPMLDAPDEWYNENLRQVWQLECDLMPYLARMYDKGLAVDMEYGAVLMDDENPRSIKAAIKKAMEQFEPGFNPRSGKDCEKLYRANGYGDDDFSKTSTGAPSFTEAWLETNDIGEAILDVRRLEKMRDSFVIPLIDTQNHFGRVHPVLNQSKTDDYGVIGGRLSCSTPNLQAFPKRNKLIGKTVRPLIKADYGHIYEDDFKQQEPRFFTHFSDEPTLIEAYRSGTMDIHDVADSFFNIGRDKAKRLGLGILTGLGAESLATRMRWSKEQAETAKRKFFTEAFPNIRQFQLDATATFKNRGVVRSILGRRAQLESPKFAYVAVSRIIQNSGGDHMKTALLRACQYAESESYDGIDVLLSIHDSTLFQADPNSKHPAEIKRLVEAVAQEPQFDIIVPIPVDEGHGPNWGVASYGEKAYA